MFEIIANEPDGFTVKSNGKIITSNFDCHSVSPVSVNEGITSVRNAVKFRSEERWAHLVNVKDGRKIKTSLLNLLLIEFDWWFFNGCEALGICVPSDDVIYVESAIKYQKNKDRIRVFSVEEPETCQQWINSKVSSL